MKKHFDYFIRSATDWVFRRRSPALILVRTGAGLLLAALAIGLSLGVRLVRGHDSLDVQFNSAEGPSELVTWIITGIGGLLLAGGTIWEIRRQRAAERERRAQRVIVIESRGLRNFNGSALTDAVPDTIEGVRESILIDTRENVIDGEILHPSEAIQKIQTAQSVLASRQGNSGRSNQTIVYGGLSPVPFSFLLGVLLDDEGAIVTMDWDRSSETWRQLDGEDDGARFAIRNLETLAHGTSEAVLAVSVSYAANHAGISQKFPTLPIVELSLPNLSPAGHWSEVKQAALAQQFLDTAIQLEARGVSRIHLVLACQNSVAFRLGRSYDKRNLPSITVYQYEVSKTPPYPWGINMPVAGARTAQLVEQAPAS